MCYCLHVALKSQKSVMEDRMKELCTNLDKMHAPQVSHARKKMIAISTCSSWLVTLCTFLANAEDGHPSLSGIHTAASFQADQGSGKTRKTSRGGQSETYCCY